MAGRWSAWARAAAGVAALAVATLTGAAPGDAARGRALYLGEEVMQVVGADGQARPMPQAACVHCHRRSGLGSFEGSLGAPPIAGPTLFRPHDRDTGGFFRDLRRDRVRPAYDEASLFALLAGGQAPDGERMRAPMPRYAIDAQAAADLAAWLRGLGSEPPTGIDAHELRIATVVAPGVAPAERAALEAVAARFVALKNAQPRHEAQRARQAMRDHEMAMNAKYRTWRHELWVLEGDPAGWEAQLARRQRERPVFALVGGLGLDRWQPVDAFCERERLPCLLPLLDAAPQGGFYGVYFHRGEPLDIALAAQALREAGVRRVALWTERAPPADADALLGRAGLARSDVPDADGVLSLLPPAAHLARLASLPTGRFVAWAPGRRAPTEADWARAAAPLKAGVFVTPLRPDDGRGTAASARSEAWLRQQGLAGVDRSVAAATLQALTVFGEAFSHLDFGFSREYLVELLEHGLENMVVYGPYERLAISPGQRVAAPGSHVAAVRDGARLGWAWRTGQNLEITTTELSALPFR